MHEIKRMSGFSLIEAMIAFLIIGIGLLGAAKMQALLMTDSAVSQQRGEAVVVAQDLIEHFRSFTTLPTTSGSVAYYDIVSSTAAETVNGINASYSRAWTVEECCIDQTTSANACPAANCGSNAMRWKNLSVAVSWTDQGNTTNSVNLTTKIARLSPASDGTLLAASTVTASPVTTTESTPTTTSVPDTSSTPVVSTPSPTQTSPTVIVSSTTLSCSKTTAVTIDKNYAFNSCAINNIDSSAAKSCSCTLVTQGQGNSNSIYNCLASATILNSASAPTVIYIFAKNSSQIITSTDTMKCL